MSADRGTLNVLGDAVFVVLSVPVAALHGFDDDGDGLLSRPELEAHHDALRDEIDRRFAVLDGETPARTVALDLTLSPDHEVAQDRAPQLIALKHAAFVSPPTRLTVRSDLLRDLPDARTIELTASRNPPSGPEHETATLRRGVTEHRWFAPRGAALAAGGRGASAQRVGLRGAVAAGLAALAAASAWAVARRRRLAG